jgi:U32 family peptidase
MKIKAPLSNKGEVKNLCMAGADEFFCGIEPASWKKKYQCLPINQRRGSANFTNTKDLAEAVDSAHKFNAKVHVTINAFFPMEKQYAAVTGLIKDILDMKADGFVFADLGLLLKIDKKLLKDKDMVIGTDAVMFNSEAVNFYKSFGATRIVLDRAMTLSEMKETMDKDRSIEYEAFIINDLCYFVDGLCTFCKAADGQGRKIKAAGGVDFFSTPYVPGRSYSGGCGMLFKRDKVSAAGHRVLKGQRSPGFSFWGKKHIQGCGACAIYDLKRIGVTSLKILDRALPEEEKVKSTRFIKESLGFLDKRGLTREGFFYACRKLFKRTFKTACSRHDCYYPGIFKN